jgi:hypothetical protein
MILVISFDVDSGMWRLIIKAVVVAESVEWTPVRYRLSIRYGELSVEIRQSTRGL